jgi:hypothetical protein
MTPSMTRANVLVASDLDRTLIYSRRARTLGADDAPSVCVERHDGKAASFVTAVAAERLVTLAERATLVPVTTRVTGQYARVRLPGPPPRFAVVANGGVLLVDGTPDADWRRQIERTLATTFPLSEVWQQVGHVCRPEFTIKLRNAAGLFCYALVHPHHLPPGFLADIGGWAAERGWTVSLQGRKLYWVPVALTKSAAVAEVARRCAAQTVLAAGDSLLDVDLLLAADRGIRPAHGELFDQGWSAPHVERTVASGIAAGEEIVAWFQARVAAR